MMSLLRVPPALPIFGLVTLHPPASAHLIPGRVTCSFVRTNYISPLTLARLAWNNLCTSLTSLVRDKRVFRVS